MALGRKTGGRKRGTINKRTADSQDRAERVLLMIESDFLEKDIKQLSASQRMQLYSDMLEYRLPKLSRAEIKTQNETYNYNVNLSPEEAKKISKGLLDEY